MKKLKFILLGLLILNPINVLAYSSHIIPGGENIGIQIKYDGILIVGFYDINGKSNSKNLKIGDRILKVNNNSISSIDELVNSFDKYQTDGKVTLTIIRGSTEKKIEFELIYDNGIYKTGLYVKDSISGIGTLTYIDPETKVYGALGHEVIESNSKSKVEVKTGTIFKSSVSSIDRSVNGNPGTKNARFYSNNVYGNITKNTNYGIYGNYNEVLNKDLVEVGKPEDLKLGSAIINTVTSGEEIIQYEINITKIDKKSDIKNIYFEITDERLLEQTGGIVQGMSGSPILQDGKIYGAVTHVVIENVKKGYGIFITTMLEEGER